MGVNCLSGSKVTLYYVGTNEYGDIVEKTNIEGYTRTITTGNDNNTVFVDNDGIIVSSELDTFNRISTVKTEDSKHNTVLFSNYEYKNGTVANSSIDLVKTLTQKRGDVQLVKYEYSYNDNGNIISIKENDTEIVRYTYDSLNQLIASADAITGIYTSYTYDNFGNILKVQEYELNTSDLSESLPLDVTNNTCTEINYTYNDTNWKDKLTSYNGTSITYDAMGNPLTYRDGMEFTWENGRNLAKVEIGDNTVNMGYDSNGLRTQKQNNNNITDYYYDINENLIGINTANNILYFYYDADGNPTALSYHDRIFYYIKNLQGDIVGIVDSSGNIVVTYTYDAWGKVISQTDTTNIELAILNPLRYRGYVYDTETGLYYLKSRYYDPATGRFLNADIYCDTQSHILGTNMFAYCNNNPVNQVDPEGTDAIWLQFEEAVRFFEKGVGEVLDFISPLDLKDVGFGHTSLLLEDESNNWWYFYWGDKQAMLRPYGEVDFEEEYIYSLNSYLAGFDPRTNRYVYATNVMNDREDANYNNGPDYYMKCHDGHITGSVYFYGDFTDSLEYAKNLLENLYMYSNANQKYETVVENGEKIKFLRICEKIYFPYTGKPNRYYLKPLQSTNKEVVQGYDGLFNNCVQVSMDVLLKGEFDSNSTRYKEIILEDQSYAIPNIIYMNLIDVSGGGGRTF